MGVSLKFVSTTDELLLPQLLLPLQLLPQLLLPLLLEVSFRCNSTFLPSLSAAAVGVSAGGNAVSLDFTGWWFSAAAVSKDVTDVNDVNAELLPQLVVVVPDAAAAAAAAVCLLTTRLSAAVVKRDGRLDCIRESTRLSPICANDVRMSEVPIAFQESLEESTEDKYTHLLEYQ